MSSLLDKLENKALGAIESRGEDWIEKAIAAGRKEVAGVGGSPELEAVRVTAEMSLDKLETWKAPLAKMGYERACAFLGRVAIGQNERAAAIVAAYGGGQGAWGAADAIVAARGNATEQAKRDQDAALAMAKDFGSAAAKAALPLLLSLVAL
jgi:hypothetical protein